MAHAMSSANRSPALADAQAEQFFYVLNIQGHAVCGAGRFESKFQYMTDRFQFALTPNLFLQPSSGIAHTVREALDQW
jgi:hypothetical protein